MLKKFFLSIPCVLLAIQFVRPPENIPAESDRAHDLMALHSPPANVRRMLEAACYDCHSNHTRYPWYAELQPMRWWMDQHVRDGKRQLNFSEFGRLSTTQAQRKLEDCIDEIAEGRMPLRSYTLVHRDARLSEEQLETFTAWAEEVIERLDDRAEAK